jgi:uncharacterized DUF497 family protein
MKAACQGSTPADEFMCDRQHGIDFYEAQGLWDDPDLIEIPVQTIDEPRYLVTGTRSGKHW